MIDFVVGGPLFDVKLLEMYLSFVVVVLSIH